MSQRGLVLLVLALEGCSIRSESQSAGALHPTPPPPVIRQSDNFEQLQHRYAAVKAIRTYNGKATFYSSTLAGHKMASGATYDPNSAQAAHRTLPFGTIVRVTIPASNTSVIVRITDRGPYGKGRIIDLSHAAAERLGMIRAGVADVRLDILEIP